MRASELGSVVVSAREQTRGWNGRSLGLRLYGFTGVVATQYQKLSSLNNRDPWSQSYWPDVQDPVGGVGS